MRTIPVLIGVMAIIFLLVVSNASAASVSAVNVSAAAFHTVVLTSDGMVYTWGATNTAWGVLGTGADQSDGSLRRVDGLPTIASIDACFKTSLAVDLDGRVWAWGDNEYGQCGNSQIASFSSPVLISGLSNIVQVSCGGLHCAAVDKDGHVWTWGDNLYGELGLGYTGTAQYTPVQISINDVKMVAAGMGYTVALKSDGTVWAWGENDWGMTGGSSKDNTLWPSQVQGLWNIVKIDAGYDHTLALRSDGTIWGWGDGKENNLLDGQGYYGTVFENAPRQINGLAAATDIVAADHSSMALGSDGIVYVWGANGDGQYGNSIDLWTPATTPQKVPGLDNVIAIAGGLGHCVAVGKDGSVWAWGKNDDGQVQPGKGKKVMAPLKKIDGDRTISGQTTEQQPSQVDPSSSAGTDLTFYITAGGVILLALAVIGFIVLLRLRK
jgi:alpha-tubulin suppressor-like RCC1 family protein